jgi:hypothetical protein
MEPRTRQPSNKRNEVFMDEPLVCIHGEPDLRKIV